MNNIKRVGLGNRKGKDKRWQRKALILTSCFHIHVHTHVTYICENLPVSLHHAIGVATASLQPLHQLLLVEVDNTSAAAVTR